MKAKQKEFSEIIQQISKNNEDMIKITDDTLYDYWYSAKRVEQIGVKNAVNGIPYVEMIRSGRKPILSKKYSDLVLVHRGKLGKNKHSSI